MHIYRAVPDGKKNKYRDRLTMPAVHDDFFQRIYIRVCQILYKLSHT